MLTLGKSVKDRNSGEEERQGKEERRKGGRERDSLMMSIFKNAQYSNTVCT